mmetsp:Transcript_34823/g.62078  ORF Transcript_34823/g.62078 Transcript_34823/m.62078 type:complete len:254 (+) Transcript_34823:20-781(+)
MAMKTSRLRFASLRAAYSADIPLPQAKKSSAQHRQSNSDNAYYSEQVADPDVDAGPGSFAGCGMPHRMPHSQRHCNSPAAAPASTLVGEPTAPEKENPCCLQPSLGASNVNSPPVTIWNAPRHDIPSESIKESHHQPRSSLCKLGSEATKDKHLEVQSDNADMEQAQDQAPQSPSQDTIDGAPSQFEKAAENGTGVAISTTYFDEINKFDAGLCQVWEQYSRVRGELLQLASDTQRPAPNCAQDPVATPGDEL